MSEVNSQLTESKQVAVVKPTDLNFEIFGKYRAGATIEQLGQEYGVEPKSIYHHLDKVKAFLGDSWQKFTLTDMQLEYGTVKPEWQKLVKRGHQRQLTSIWTRWFIQIDQALSLSRLTRP